MAIVSAKEKTDDAVRLISAFQGGNIKPLSLGEEPLFQWMNDIMVAGLLPSTIITIGGMSNHGKTHLLQRIEDNLIKQGDDVVLVRCNWESSVYKLVLRKISNKTGVPIKQLLLKEPSPELRAQIKAICDEERQGNLHYNEKIVTPDEFYNDLSAFLKEHKNKKVVVTIDHAGLIKGREKQSIDALFEKLNILKKEHPYAVFIVLMQLEKSKLPARLGQHFKEAPTRDDFYGSDQLFQVSDGVFTVYNPYKIGAQTKFMKFTKDRYQYLSEFMVNGGDKWNHFDPRGNIFYHAIKARDIDSMEDFKEVFIESLYDVKEPEVETNHVTPNNVDNILNM